MKRSLVMTQLPLLPLNTNQLGLTISVVTVIYLIGCGYISGACTFILIRLLKFIIFICLVNFAFSFEGTLTFLVQQLVIVFHSFICALIDS